MRKLLIGSAMTISVLSMAASDVSAHEAHHAEPARTSTHQGLTVLDFVVPALPLAAGASGYAVSMALDSSYHRRRRQRARITRSRAPARTG